MGEGPPPTKGKRFMKLAKMTAKVAGKSASQKLSRLVGRSQSEQQRAEHHAWTGQEIAATLGELKGAAMKLGQMAAATWDLLPPEMADALRVLQKDVPPASFDQVAAQIVSELGQEPHALFAHIERTPLGTASIGQVHRARTHQGQQVVVKVQHAGIDEAVDSDLAQIRTLAKLKGTFIDKAALEETFDEVRLRMTEELDFEHEAQMCRDFQMRFADDSSVVIPHVLTELSSKRVLTTSFEPSDPLDRLVELDYSQDTRNKIGTRLFSILWEQIFIHNSLHADPHPGNFGARPDGRLVVYDYGCIKPIPKEFVVHYGELICAAFVEDYARVEAVLQAMGVRRMQGPEVSSDYYRSWRNLGLKPFLDHQIYDFSRSEIHQNLVKKVPEAIKYVSSFKPVRDLIFIDRTLFGQFGNLRGLKAQVPCFEILQRHLPELQSMQAKPS